MKTRRTLSSILLFALSLACHGHEDPNGEVNPYFVEKNGELLVYYTIKDTEGYTPYSAKVSAEGEVYDRRRIPHGEHGAATYPMWERLSWDGEAWLTLAHDGERPGLTRLGDNTSTFLQLNWQGSSITTNRYDSATGAYVVGNYYAVTYEAWDSSEVENLAQLKSPRVIVYFFDRSSRSFVWQTPIGRPARLMTTEVHSPFVEWKGQPVVAVATEEGEQDGQSPKPCRIDLVSFDVPNRESTRETIIPEVTSNTQLDLRLWRGGLYLIYHNYELKDLYDIGTPLPQPATIRVKKITMSNKAFEAIANPGLAQPQR